MVNSNQSELKIYSPRRSAFIHILIAVFILLPILVFVVGWDSFSARPYLIISVLPPIVIILHIYFNTYYCIGQGKLFYKSGFLKGEIPISQIKEVVKNITIYMGVKPALGPNGLLIKYNKWDELYITPEDNDVFVMDLLKENDQIKVSA